MYVQRKNDNFRQGIICIRVLTGSICGVKGALDTAYVVECRAADRLEGRLDWGMRGGNLGGESLGDSATGTERGERG